MVNLKEKLQKKYNFYILCKNMSEIRAIEHYSKLGIYCGTFLSHGFLKKEKLTFEDPNCTSSLILFLIIIVS